MPIALGFIDKAYINTNTWIDWFMLGDSVGNGGGKSEIAGNFTGCWISHDAFNSPNWSFSIRITTAQYNRMTANSKIVLNVYII